ncbi:MAG TPA: M1 family aminopeptidase [Vicinamibacterales bacterium]|nr:M1 family aminopeptidase [Vicinamibacterales bacterium]
MFRRWYLVLVAVVCLASIAWFQRHRRVGLIAVPIVDGIPQALAVDRAGKIRSLRYGLSLSIPERKQDPIRGHETLRFDLTDASQPLQLDFAQPADRVSSITANGKALSVDSAHGHLILPAASLGRGTNELSVDFTAGDRALNRNDDYLYSLFVPARASQTFPCFDQPDLKGSLTLALEIPSGWEAVANGFEKERQAAGNRKTIHFAPTQALPTYLFGFAAGKFTAEESERGGRTFRMYHRETDAARVARNKDALFDLHQQAIAWMEDYTARRYPFDKLDFVLLPAFQFSGMEHAGAIFYNQSSLLLDETATQEQELARATTIAHETSHMWFGDLVTMKWFDDVWMKEVFANFMAAKIVNPAFPDIDHALRFLMAHYPSAYDVDRTTGANPIRQRLDNLNEAGSLYGNIIYDKAPVVMRQLEEMLGADGLRDGLREYLNRYAFGNAAWTDLIAILGARTGEDLAAWSHAWVDEPGRPTIATELKIDAGHITGLGFTQSDPRGRPLVWNQPLQIAMGFEHGTRITPLKMNAARVEPAGVRGIPQPRYILPNGEGIGYGLFKLDDMSKAFLLNSLPELGDALTRGAAWITIWDDMLEGGTPAGRVVDLALKALPLEREEQNVQRILSYLTGAYWIFLPEAERAAVAPRVESALRAGMNDSAGRSLKAAYFNAFRAVATTPAGVAHLERLWKKQDAVPGLTFAESDYIAMAEELAVRNGTNGDMVAARQLKLIENPDRKARFVFITPALSSSEATRDAFFGTLAEADNRRHEPWVIDALRYLNHPLRARHARVYIRPSLDLLREIQRTGDIFFPSRWTSAVLSGHNSPEAAGAVTAFLEEHSDYPPRLRQIIEQSSDALIRASRIVRDR